MAMPRPSRAGISRSASSLNDRDQRPRLSRWIEDGAMDDLMIIGAWPLVFAASYALCWFTEVNWRDRKITELEAEVDRQDDRIEKIRGVLRGVRLELNAREAELSTLKATAITRDAKGHFKKVKA
jgi:hypothetical protein